ncbi:MAG: tetratricopeptide repeat protein [Kiritimatiellae bacterium]|nr:tetratricopeptide repeat protein [Kiritimatiellia bacterium]
MAEIVLEETSKQVQDMFNKGFSAFERGNLDYAIDMFLYCVESEPSFLQARKFLRAAVLQKFKKKNGGAFGRVISGAAGYVKAMALFKSGKTDLALIDAERLLKNDPLNLKYMRLFSEISRIMGIPEAGILTMEMARDQAPDDIKILKLLGDLYGEIGMTTDARICLERLCDLSPRDPAALKALKDAMAVDSMSKDKWVETAEKGESFRNILKDSDEAAMLERENKSVMTGSDSSVLIDEAIAKIENDPQNINYHRALTRLYVRDQNFDDAISTLQNAIKLSPGDPELDRAMSVIRLQVLDQEIEEISKTGDAEALAAKQTERAQFQFDDLQDRVKRYPNDLDLRYAWGEILFHNDNVDEAIQQFQLSQKSPKHRVLSLYHLGLCFKTKKQYDMAKSQLEQADEQVSQMNDDKKNICYELGSVLDLMDDKAGALECYKRVYQVDISFRDISQKIEQAYEGAS